MSDIRMHLWISGRVQGVFFRQSTWQRAQAIGELKGWVRNLRDGRVEVLVQGPEAHVRVLVDYCHHGPSSARVDGVEQREETPQGDLTRFEIS
ncbi:MAG TPA: acylphosphatase [Candidatus Obscuribacterales bacterium]